MASGDAKASRSGGSPSTTGRFARWLAGWRVAIRIARRDARRYKWRSALIVAMVGLPVLLLTSGITLMATTDVSMAESVPRVMGSAQARISSPGIVRLVQSPDGQPTSSNDNSEGAVALAVPGFAPDSAWTTSKVQSLTGGRVIPTIDGWMRVTLGDRRPSMLAPPDLRWRHSLGKVFAKARVSFTLKPRLVRLVAAADGAAPTAR